VQRIVGADAGEQVQRQFRALARPQDVGGDEAGGGVVWAQLQGEADQGQGEVAGILPAEHAGEDDIGFGQAIERVAHGQGGGIGLQAGQRHHDVVVALRHRAQGGFGFRGVALAGFPAGDGAAELEVGGAAELGLGGAVEAGGEALAV